MVKNTSIETRKVQKTSDGTVLISLPKNWAKRFNLKKGSQIYVRERADGCLVLDPQYAVDVSPEITLKFSKRVEDAILSSYLSGYEIVTIEAPKLSDENMGRIKHAVNRLIGVEIIEEDSSKVVLQCMLKPTAFPPEKVLRREYVLSSSMFKEAFEAFVNSNIELAENIPKRDEEIDRLYFLLVRLLRSLIINPRLSEKMEISLIDCLDYRLIASLIENIADQALEIASKIVEIKHYKLPAEILEKTRLLEKAILSAYEEVIRAIFSKNEQTLIEAIRKREEASTILEEIEERFREQKKFNQYLIFTFLAMIHRVIDYIKDMADLVTAV